MLLIASKIITQITMATQDVSMSSCSSDTCQTTCQQATSTPGAPKPLRLGPVETDQGKTNDVVFCGKGKSNLNVLYFGGDVQVWHMQSALANFPHTGRMSGASLDFLPKRNTRVVFQIKQQEHNTSVS